MTFRKISMTSTSGIGYENALAKFKILSLKSLESWVKAVCDDKAEDVIKDLVSEDTYETIPGTIRKYLRLNRDQDKFYCVHFINDWDHLWQYLASTPYDQFGANCVHFRNYCMFLFHGKTALILTSVQIYITLVGIVTISMDYSSVSYWVFKIFSITIFYGIYLATYHIFRGTMLKTDNLRPFVGSRVGIEKTVAMVDGTSQTLAVDAGADDDEMENDSTANPLFSVKSTGDGSEDDIEGAASAGNTPPTNEVKKKEVYWCTLWYLLWKAIFLTVLSPLFFILGNLWNSFKQFLYSRGDASMRNRIESTASWGSKSNDSRKKLQKESKTVSLTATASLMSFFRRGWNSLVVAASTKKEEKMFGFYHLLNVCQKFFVIFGENSMHRKPPWFIEKGLMFIVGWVLFNTYASVVSGNADIHATCVSKHYPHPEDQTPSDPTYSDEFCRTFQFYQIATLGGFITASAAIITCSSLFVSFAGLAYAADIAEKLASIWITRYQPIRKVAYDGLMGPNTATATDEEIALYFSGVLHNYMDAMNAAGVGNSTATQSVAQDTADSLGASNASSLEPPCLEEIAARAGLDINIKDLVKLLPLYDKDATECFLFRQVYMQLITAIWNPFLVCLVITMLMVVLVSCITVFSVENLISNLILSSVLFLYPLICVAYANNAIHGLLQFITGAGLDDFKLLGGRNVLLEYAQNNMSYWCIMDVPFTCKAVSYVYRCSISYIYIFNTTVSLFVSC